MESKTINLAEFEVVRQEGLTDQNVPLLTFSKGRIHVNKYCLNRFREKEYIQLLVDKKKSELIVYPQSKKIKDAVRWSSSGKKRIPRHVLCMPFYYMIFKMMSWDMECRYRITGEIIESDKDSVILFSLKNAVCFEPTEEMDERGNKKWQQHMPLEWKDSFGISYSEIKEEDYLKIYESDGVFEVELPIDFKNRGNIQKLESIKQEGNSNE